MCTRELLFSVWSWDAMYMLPAALLLWGLATGPRTLPALFLSSKPMVLMGQASFAFYLVHVPLLAGWAVPSSTPASWVAALVIQFTLIMFVAIGLHLHLEVPVQRQLLRVLRRTPPGQTAEHPEVAQVAVTATEGNRP